MKFTATSLAGAWVIDLRVFHDARGFFMETYRRDAFAAHGIHDEFLQSNQSFSVRHTLRGLHFQVGRPQSKLVRALRGEVFDVIVDVRRGSPTYGRWISVVLSAENKKMLFVPVGFAHGFCVTSTEAEVLYACGDFYYPPGESGIVWDDPDLAISWPTTTPIISDKDRRLPRFNALGADFTWPDNAVSTEKQ